MVLISSCLLDFATVLSLPSGFDPFSSNRENIDPEITSIAVSSTLVSHVEVRFFITLISKNCHCVKISLARPAPGVRGGRGNTWHHGGSPGSWQSWPGH